MVKRYTPTQIHQENHSKVIWKEERVKMGEEEIR